MRRLGAALRLRDLHAVEQRMDVAAVARTLADDWVAARARDASEGGPATVAALDSLEAEAARAAQAIERDLRGALREDALAPGSILGELATAARLDRAKLGRVVVDGTGTGNRPARLELRYPHLDTALVLDGTMAIRADRWVLTGIRGLDEAGRTIQDVEAARLLAINQPVHDAIAGMLRMGDPSLVVDSTGRPPRWVAASVMVENVSQLPLSELRLRVHTTRHPFAAVSVDLAAGDTIPPGSSGRLTGRLEGPAVFPFLAVLRGRDDLAVTITRAVAGEYPAARRYQAAEGWEQR